VTSLDNHALSQVVETSDEWITYGLEFVTDGWQQYRTLSAIASQASRGALTMAGITPADLDMIILATSTDDLFGSACQIQSLEPPEQLPLTLQQLAPAVWTCHRCPVPQNWRYQKYPAIGADISPAG